METKQAIITGIFLGNGLCVLSRISVRTAFATQDGADIRRKLPMASNALSREAQPLQELRVTLVRAQSFQYRVDFHERQAAVVLSIGAVQPRKCAVRFITIGVYLSDLACPLVLAIGDKLLQSGI